MAEFEPFEPHELTDQPPQQWVQCDECCGEGEVGTGRMSHMVDSATIDPPEEIMKQCETCRGAGGWMDDVEPNRCDCGVLCQDRGALGGCRYIQKQSRA